MMKSRYLFKRIMIYIFSINLLCITGCAGCGENEKVISQPISQDVETVAEVESDSEVLTSEMSETSSGVTDGGGNPYSGLDNPVTRFEIRVSEDDYHYNNRKIVFDDFIAMIENTPGDIIVRISDENATYRAYSKLIEKLQEMEIEIEIVEE